MIEPLDPPQLPIDNPMWDRVKDYVTPSRLPWSQGLMVGGLPSGIPRNRPEEIMAESVVMQLMEQKPDLAEGVMDAADPLGPLRTYLERPQEDRVADILDQVSWLELRADIVRQYAWTITDPWSVQFVAEWAGPRVLDPMAGTGYWGWLLTQLGTDARCFDAYPPQPGQADNHFHQDAAQFMPVAQLDAAQASALHGRDRTLLLAWPPMSKDGYRTLKAYQGQRLIYIGENGGCTGDEHLQMEIAVNWTEVDAHVPVQFWGLNDVITVYDRNRKQIDLGHLEHNEE